MPPSNRLVDPSERLFRRGSWARSGSRCVRRRRTCSAPDREATTRSRSIAVPMRLVILEPGLSGHHSAYLRWLLEATSRRGWPTVLATSRAAEEQPVLRHVLAGFSHVEVHWIKERHALRFAPRGAWSLLARDLQYRRMFRLATRSACINQRIDGVLVPYLDYCFYSISMFG